MDYRHAENALKQSQMGQMAQGNSISPLQLAYAGPVEIAQDRMPEVGQQTTAIEGLTVDLMALTDALEKQLSPILHNHLQPGENSAVAPDKILCPLADNLRHSSARLSALYSRLLDIQRRIEL